MHPVRGTHGYVLTFYYVFQFNGQPAYANLRGCYEFSAQNRVEGYAIFATISIPLGSAGK